jgi:hypothetical protein
MFSPASSKSRCTDQPDFGNADILTSAEKTAKNLDACSIGFGEALSKGFQTCYNGHRGLRDADKRRELHKKNSRAICKEQEHAATISRSTCVDVETRATTLFDGQRYLLTSMQLFFLTKPPEIVLR